MPPLENPIRGEGTEAAEDCLEAAEAAEDCLEAAEAAEDCLEAAADIDADPSFATKLEADRDGAPEALDVLAVVAFSTALSIAVSTAVVNNPTMYSRSCPNCTLRSLSRISFLAIVAGVTASAASSTDRLSSPGKYRNTNSIKDGSSVCDLLGTLAFAIYLPMSLIIPRKRIIVSVK